MSNWSYKQHEVLTKSLYRIPSIMAIRMRRSKSSFLELINEDSATSFRPTEMSE